MLVVNLLSRLKIRKSTHLWMSFFFRKVPPCYPSGIVGPLESCLNGWNLGLSDMFLNAPTGILIILIRSGVPIITLKQPSNKSSTPFKKSEINKYF